MSEQKVDIFKMLRHIDSGDLSFYANLSDAEKKSISMFVAARWQSCTKNEGQIVATNALVNSTVFAFGQKHDGLLYRLMLIASSGTEKRYTWVSKSKRKSKRPESTAIIAKYYDISTKDADMYNGLLSMDIIIEMAESLGMDNSVIKRVKNEHKA